MEPYETPKAGSNTEDSPRGRKAGSRITWVEALIIVAIVAALVAWLPKAWNR